MARVMSTRGTAPPTVVTTTEDVLDRAAFDTVRVNVYVCPLTIELAGTVHLLLVEEPMELS